METVLRAGGFVVGDGQQGGSTARQHGRTRRDIRPDAEGTFGRRFRRFLAFVREEADTGCFADRPVLQGFDRLSGKEKYIMGQGGPLPCPVGRLPDRSCQHVAVLLIEQPEVSFLLGDYAEYLLYECLQRDQRQSGTETGVELFDAIDLYPQNQVCAWGPRQFPAG